MKKFLLGITFVFYSIIALEVQGYFSDSVKWALADKIDNTDGLFIRECSDILSECEFQTGNCNNLEFRTRLILDALNFRHIWRILGNDPYFANWAAQFYAEYVIGYLKRTGFQPGCETYGEAALKELSKVSVSDNNLKRDIPQQQERDEMLQHTFFKSSFEKQSDDKKSDMLIYIKGIIMKIFSVMKFELKNDTSGKKKRKLQQILLPHDMIYNIRANNRVFKDLPFSGASVSAKNTTVDS